MTVPASLARRSHLAALLALGLSACASRGPVADESPPPPRQKPERIGLLAIAPVAEIGYQYRRGTKTFFGMLGGAGALIAHGMERTDSKTISSALAKEGLQPADHLRATITAALGGAEGIALDDRARIDAAVKRWDFKGFAAECDATLYVDLSEVAYAAWSSEAVSPRIYATMWLISTRDGEELGTATYQIRIDPDKSDPRSMLPLRSSRFASHEAMIEGAGQVATALRAELDRIGQLIVGDVRTMQRGAELVWEKV